MSSRIFLRIENNREIATKVTFILGTDDKKFLAFDEYDSVGSGFYLIDLYKNKDKKEMLLQLAMIEHFSNLSDAHRLCNQFVFNEQLKVYSCELRGVGKDDFEFSIEEM